MENKNEYREEYIKMLIDAIKRFGEHPDALENFEGYLGYHFESWAKKFAATPESFISELDQFSKIY